MTALLWKVTPKVLPCYYFCRLPGERQMTTQFFLMQICKKFDKSVTVDMCVYCYINILTSMNQGFCWWCHQGIWRMIILQITNVDQQPTLQTRVMWGCRIPQVMLIWFDLFFFFFYKVSYNSPNYIKVQPWITGLPFHRFWSCYLMFSLPFQINAFSDQDFQIQWTVFSPKLRLHQTSVYLHSILHMFTCYCQNSSI